MRMVRGGSFFSVLGISLFLGSQAVADDIEGVPPECFEDPFFCNETTCEMDMVPCICCPCFFSVFPDGNKCAFARCRNRNDCPTMYALVTRRGNSAITPEASTFGCQGQNLEIEFYGRCWSNGDPVIPGTAPLLTGYQITLDCASFFSGTTGSIAPRRFFELTDPNGVCCGAEPVTGPVNPQIVVNRDHPLYVFRNEQANPDEIYPDPVIVTQTVRCGYAATVSLFDITQQPGVTAYCPLEGSMDQYLATVRVQVSNDATGEFQFCANDINTDVVPGLDRSNFRTPNQGAGTSTIFPMEFECATIEAIPRTDPRCTDVPVCNRTLTGGPLHNRIDARQPSDPDGSNMGGLSMVDADYSGGNFCFEASQFTVATTPPGTAPSVTTVAAVDSNTIKITLGARIPAARWTQITHMEAGDDVCFGFQPGDVNGDGTANATDVDALRTLLGAMTPCNDYQCDIDRSGEDNMTNFANLLDLAREMELLIGSETYNVPAGSLGSSPCG